MQSAGEEASGACMEPGLMSCSYCIFGPTTFCGDKPCLCSGKSLDTLSWFPPLQLHSNFPPTACILSRCSGAHADVGISAQAEPSLPSPTAFKGKEGPGKAPLAMYWCSTVCEVRDAPLTCGSSMRRKETCRLLPQRGTLASKQKALQNHLCLQYVFELRRAAVARKVPLSLPHCWKGVEWNSFHNWELCFCTIRLCVLQVPPFLSACALTETLYPTSAASRGSPAPCSTGHTAVCPAG